MPLNFDDRALAVVEAAKRATPEGAPLGVGTLLAAALHLDGAEVLAPALLPLRQHVNAPKPVRNAAGKVPVDEALGLILNDLATRDRPVTVADLLRAMLTSRAGAEFLQQRGVPAELMANIIRSVSEATASAPQPATAPAAPPAGNGDWRTSEQRGRLLKALGSFGRMLTESPPPARGTFENDTSLRGLITTLSKMGRHNAIVVGHPGTGKTALIYELARRLARRDETLPPRLRDMDLFELNPTFLRSGASVVGQYEERIKELLTVLRDNPKIIVFIDEVHSMFRSGVHGGHSPWSDANESFKGSLGRGEIQCIGATTWAEYRHAIEPDGALARRFDIIRVDPPTRARATEILRSRLGKLQQHYAPLKIGEALCERAVEMTDEYLPSRFQPDKSIQLMDQACALCVTKQPPGDTLSEADLMSALEQTVGHRLMRTDDLSEGGVLAKLKEGIVGQDAVLEGIARAFMAGLGNWRQRQRPRGVFLFGGPTGVGKTETALQLARILGGDHEQLIRVDCNTLQTVASNDGSAQWRLLGVPPGFEGHARGQGGLLSPIRENPECVVLFDEFEKADSSVGNLLLRIIDEGKCQDTEGNDLDFRRSFIIFTSNAGCEYPPDQPFGLTPAQGPATPVVSLMSLQNHLRAIGIGQEFIARIEHTFLFTALDGPAVRIILERHLQALARTTEGHNLKLSWAANLIEHLASQWQPRYGVRYLAVMLKHRVIEQLSLADAQSELRDVTSVHVRPLAGPAADRVGFATRHREKDCLIIELA